MVKVQEKYYSTYTVQKGSRELQYSVNKFLKQFLNVELNRSWHLMGKENSQGMKTVEKVMHTPEHKLERDNTHNLK